MMRMLSSGWLMIQRSRRSCQVWSRGSSVAVRRQSPSRRPLRCSQISTGTVAYGITVLTMEIVAGNAVQRWFFAIKTAEIGRASCREREESGGEADGLENEKEKVKPTT